ncbi:MAG: hypothetical protein ACHP8B_09065 [Terriglobales bacterium]
MGANNGVGDVSIGLGKKNNISSRYVISPTGTATLHFPWQDMGPLMAAHGQVLESLVADYPVDPRERAAATIYNQSAVTKGWTRMTFSNARIMSVQVVPGGAVEVTLHHFGASQSPPVQSTLDPDRNGVRNNTSKSNVLNSSDVVQRLVPSATPWKVFSTNLNSSRSGM